MPRVLFALAATLALVLPVGASGVASAYELTEDARCLALSMYWEAKNQGREGMVAVGSVVLNRVQHEEFPNTPCEVVYEGGETPPCQFSWWCDGKSDTPRDQEAWALAQQLAGRMLASPPPDPTDGALFFHSTEIGKPWRKERTRTAELAGHVFYR